MNLSILINRMWKSNVNIYVMKRKAEMDAQDRQKEMEKLVYELGNSIIHHWI